MTSGKNCRLLECSHCSRATIRWIHSSTSGRPNATFSSVFFELDVDCFSGLLTSYVTIKYTRGDYKNFRYLSFLLLRILRLTPQLGAFMLLLSLLPPMFDGPLWKIYLNEVTDKCYKTWWHNLVYMQNLIDVDNIVSTVQ